MFPTRIMWPYGGRRVFISGSFSSWSEHVRLMPVEGSMTVFQTVIHLPLGYHQYKFLVDGRWQHDPQKPYVADNFGIVNNFIEVSEADVRPSLQQIEIQNNALVMDVDRIPEHSEVATTGRNQIEHIALGIQMVDLNDSVQQLSIYLSSYTAYELVPDSSMVSVLDVNLSIKRAFHIMHDQGLAIMLLWDDSVRQISGMLTALDYILILRELRTHGSLLTTEELETHTISAWKEFKARSRGETNLRETRVIQASSQESLKDVAERIVRNEISAIPIFDSSLEDESCQKLLHLASLPDILRYICRRFRHARASSILLQQRIDRLPLGTWAPGAGRPSRRQLKILQSNAPLSTALNLLIEVGNSSIPIVDENGCFLGVYSRSDITTLASGDAYARIQLDQTSMLQALQLGYRGANRQQLYSCFRSDTFYEILERLSDPMVRRLVVIHPQTRQIEGIISLRDIFELLLR